MVSTRGESVCSFLAISVGVGVGVAISGKASKSSFSQFGLKDQQVIQINYEREPNKN